MNHSPTAATWRPGQASNPVDLGTQFRNFAYRQPELLVVGALLGGALLGFFAKNRLTATGSSPRSPVRNRVSRPDYAARPLPSARLGATEEQMAARTTPPDRALETGDAGLTGMVYDLDPASVTPG